MKRCIAVILTIILCFTLVACGMDYEEKGYTDAKEIIDARSAELWPDGVVDDDTQLGFRFLIALGGFDSFVDSLTEEFKEQLTIDSSWTEEQKALYMQGVRKAISEWVQWVSGNELN